MSHRYTARVWVAQSDRAEDVRTLLEELQQLAERIPGAEICVYQDVTVPERFVTFSEWPDRRAIETFRDQPEVDRLRMRVEALTSETYPADGALDLHDVHA